MKKHRMGEMAPNAGYSSERGVKEIAENHGAGMGIKAHHASTAVVKEFGDLDYAGEQHGDGSMDYDKIKKEKASHDAGRLKKYAKPVNR